MGEIVAAPSAPKWTVWNLHFGSKSTGTATPAKRRRMKWGLRLGLAFQLPSFIASMFNGGLRYIWIIPAFGYENA
jgi:hypothetical protein